MSPKFPRLLVLLFRLRFGHRADFILGDLMEESTARSGFWLWRQLASVVFPAPRFRWEGRMFASFWNDVRYSARTLSKNPGFALAAGIAIALGIGVNTGIFSVLNGVAFKHLPTPGANRLVDIYQEFHGRFQRNSHGAPSFSSTAEYERYRDDNHVFASLAAYAPFLKLTLGGESPRKLIGQLTSCNYFDVLQEPPSLGRPFMASDCSAPGASPVVVMSDHLWRTAFGADPAIVGRNLVLNRHPFTVISRARGIFGD